MNYPTSLQCLGTQEILTPFPIKCYTPSMLSKFIAEKKQKATSFEYFNFHC